MTAQIIQFPRPKSLEQLLAEWLELQPEDSREAYRRYFARLVAKEGDARVSHQLAVAIALVREA